MLSKRGGAMSRKTIRIFISVWLLIMAGGIFWPLLNGKSPIRFGLDISGGVIVEYTPDFSDTLETYKDKPEQEILELAKSILQSRLYTKLKITPDIVIRGDDTILVSVPSISNPNKVLSIVGQTFHLAFRPVLEELNEPPVNRRSYPFHGNYLILGKTLFSGDMLDLDKIKVTFDNKGEPQVAFSFKSPYGKKFGSYSKENVGKRLAILVDNHVEMAPKIREAITSGQGVITGDYSDEKARDTAMLLRSGAIPVSLHMDSIRVVGPSLGQQVKRSGVTALLLSLIPLLVVLTISYIQRVWLLLSGMLSVFFLLFSIFGLVSLVGFTLDIAAIAGAILTIGMGIDAFIIIFESLETTLKQFLPREIAAFYNRIIRRIYSFSGDGRVLLHSNLTTIIAIVPILYVERLKFLALFIIVGIIASTFTIFFTREVLQMTHSLSPKLGVSAIGWIRHRRIDIFRFRKVTLGLTCIACVVSFGLICISLFGKPAIKFGSEFHEGTQITARAKRDVDFKTVIDKLRTKLPDANLSYQLIHSLSKRGAKHLYQDYLISIDQSIQASHRTKTYSKSESKTHLDSDSNNLDYSGILKPEMIQSVLLDFDVKLLRIDSISSKLSSRNMMKALSVLFISFIGISLYLLVIQGFIDKRLPTPKVSNKVNDHSELRIRKRHKKPLSTYRVSLGIVTAVIHDILIMLLFCALIGIDVSLPVIAAIITMVGYSINDSVVLWAHIQNLYIARDPINSEAGAVDIVSESIDIVLSRTILTSITTLIPGLSILFTGISELASFALVIIVGVVSGTFSSIFIVGSFAVKSLKFNYIQDIAEEEAKKISISDEEFERRIGL